VGYKYDMFKINAVTGSNEAVHPSKHHAKKIFEIG